jgi:hypothetical protein
MSVRDAALVNTDIEESPQWGDFAPGTSPALRR